MRKILIVACLGLALSGCSTIESVLAPSPNIVATLQATLAAADQAAAVYIALPPCGYPAASGALLCSTDAMVNGIDTGRAAALVAIQAARANETASTVTAAENAVDAYQAVVNALPTSPPAAATSSSSN